jgi:hypothetical protein
VLGAAIDCEAAQVKRLGSFRSGSNFEELTITAFRRVLHYTYAVSSSQTFNTQCDVEGSSVKCHVSVCQAQSVQACSKSPVGLTPRVYPRRCDGAMEEGLYPRVRWRWVYTRGCDGGGSIPEGAMEVSAH